MSERFAGKTLLEVLVAGAIFALLSTILVLTMRSSHSSQLKTDSKSESQRACLATLNHLRTELRGVQLALPAVGTQTPLLRFRRPLLDPDGLVILTAGGEPSFNPTPVTYTLNSAGVLISTETPPRMLGRLFEEGSIVFNRVSAGVLEVDIVAAQGEDSPDRKSQSRIVSRIAVQNSI
jgi:type II secretory pathway pseudopilin PulG